MILENNFYVTAARLLWPLITLLSKRVYETLTAFSCKGRTALYHAELTPLNLHSVADSSSMQQTLFWKGEVHACVCIKTEH